MSSTYPDSFRFGTCIPDYVFKDDTYRCVKAGGRSGRLFLASKGYSNPAKKATKRAIKKVPAHWFAGDNSFPAKTNMAYAKTVRDYYGTKPKSAQKVSSSQKKVESIVKEAAAANANLAIALSKSLSAKKSSSPKRSATPKKTASPRRGKRVRKPVQRLISA